MRVGSRRRATARAIRAARSVGRRRRPGERIELAPQARHDYFSTLRTPRRGTDRAAFRGRPADLLRLGDLIGQATASTTSASSLLRRAMGRRRSTSASAARRRAWTATSSRCARREQHRRDPQRPGPARGGKGALRGVPRRCRPRRRAAHRRQSRLNLGRVAAREGRFDESQTLDGEASSRWTPSTRATSGGGGGPAAEGHRRRGKARRGFGSRTRGSLCTPPTSTCRAPSAPSSTGPRAGAQGR